MHCTVVNRTYPTLKSLSENQHQKLLEAKQIREQDVLEENKHAPQCNSIPMTDHEKSRHRVHLEPCYKMFTSILEPSRKQSKTEDDSKAEYRLKRQKRDDFSGLTDLNLFLLQKHRKAEKKVTYNAHKISTRNAEANIKIAAQIKNNRER